MNEKAKRKEESLIKMLTNFYSYYLDKEFLDVSIKLVKLMSQDENPMYMNDKLKRWASAIVFILAELNYVLDLPFIYAVKVMIYQSFSIPIQHHILKWHVKLKKHTILRITEISHF